MNPTFASDQSTPKVIDVTTERRNDTHPRDHDASIHDRARAISGGLSFFDEFDGLADSLYLLGGVFRNANVEFLLELHH